MYIKIGQIVNTHGHRGELKVYPLSDDPQRFYELEHVYIKRNDEYMEYHVHSVRLHQNVVIIALREIPDMNEGEKMKGLYLELPVGELRPLPPGHYYHFQIVGLEVYEGEYYLGKVEEILETGSNDVYVVKKERQKPIYLPALKEVIKKIDLDSGKMEVQIPPGLLE
ncbi:MAG: ribosome maturation factor RimM [Bacillota bacterium]